MILTSQWAVAGSCQQRTCGKLSIRALTLDQCLETLELWLERLRANALLNFQADFFPCEALPWKISGSAVHLIEVWRGSFERDPNVIIWNMEDAA